MACARALVGQYVFLQLVGVEGSLSLCEVEVFATDGMLIKLKENILFIKTLKKNKKKSNKEIKKL